MEIRRASRVLLWTCAMLCALVVFCAAECFAVDETARKDCALMDGVTESTVFVADSGARNNRVHILRIDRNADVLFKANTREYYTKNSTARSRAKKAKQWKTSNWGYEKVAGQALNYQDSKDTEGMVIGAINGDFFDYTNGEGCTLGKLIMEGNTVNASAAEPYFAVQKDGSLGIRDAGEPADGVVEAVGGRWILKDGLQVDVENTDVQPRTAIGVTKKGDVVIVTVDGRESASPGITMYDLGMIFLQQNCSDAINLDGGGSSSFLTKRTGDKELVFRNVAADGYIRNVSSSLLVVKKEGAGKGKISSGQTVSMKREGTGLSKNKDGDFVYQIGGVAQDGLLMVNGKPYLFRDGCGADEKLKIGADKYVFKGGELVKPSREKVGRIMLGYCGGKGDGTNLLYAYHRGEEKLNIGKNPMNPGSGKMRDWVIYDPSLPWYAYRENVKKIFIGDGVTNVGNYFLFVPGISGFDGSDPMKPKLTKLWLPDSMKKIGKYAFAGSGKLQDVILPSGVTKVKKCAFKQAGAGFLRLKSKTPPKFGSNALKEAGFDAVYVKKTSQWQSFVGKDLFRKMGYENKVEYKGWFFDLFHW